MIRLLHSEWLIWSRSKTVISSIGLATVALILFPLLWIQVSGTSIDRFGGFLEEAFSFPTVWMTCTFLNLFPVQLMSLLVIAITCRSFDEKTYRLHLLTGEARHQLWQRKILMIVILTIFSLFITFISAWLCGYIIDPNSGFLISLFSMSSLAAFALQVLLYLSFALLVSLLTKKLLLASMLYVLWFSLLERSIASLINKALPSIQLGNLFPGKVIEYINPFDIEALINGRYPLYNYWYLVAAITWLLAANVLNFILFQKSRF